MHCPRCHAEPVRDPFLCTMCGERLLTYLDEPLGPGTGVRPEGIGGAPRPQRAPMPGSDVAVRPGAPDDGHPDADETDARSWIARLIDPQPTEGGTATRPPQAGGPSGDGSAGRRPLGDGQPEHGPSQPWQGQPYGGATVQGRAGQGYAGLPYGGAAGAQPPGPTPPAPQKPADLNGRLVLKILFGFFLAMILLIASPLAGLLAIVGLVFFLWRWPRAPFIPYAIITIGTAGALWVVADILDAGSLPDLLTPPRPTPTVSRVFGTPTPAGPAGTPTLAPFQQTATATVVAAEMQAQISRTRARWLRGDTQAALAASDQALALAPRDVRALNMRALVRISAGDYTGAADDAKRATEIQPSAATYHDTYGYALLKLERYEDARYEYERALTTLKGPSRAASELGLGVAHMAQGRLSDAATHVQAGLSLLPDADPDPQLADLEELGRRVLAGLPPDLVRATAPTPTVVPPSSPAASPRAVPAAAPGSSPVTVRVVTPGPAPAVSPVVTSPAVTPGPAPAASPVASPAARRADSPVLLGWAP